MRHNADWWTERVSEVEAGAEIRTVARRHGVKATTLRWWRSELRRRGLTTPRLLPVVVASDAAPAPGGTGEAELVVETATARITLRGRLEPSVVDAAIRAVAAC